MKWLVTAYNMALDTHLSWTVEADSPGEACWQGFKLARENKAEEGTVEVEPLEEDKQLICDKLLEVLQITRNLHDLDDLRYIPEKELVMATFTSGAKKYANVAADSGTAMIRDIIGQIV